MSTMSSSPGSPENAPCGVDIIADAVQHLPGLPGVYRMYDSNGVPLYIGKARNLRNRVSSYTRREGQIRRIARMVSLTCSLEFVVTASESDALLLEASLIKRLRPRFNIMMRDDKSFPYILIRSDHEAPQILKYRGKPGKNGTYFGPYASTRSVNQALFDLQKAFQLRSCRDSVYAGRSRACLLYQIKRCAGPCAGHVSLPEHARLAEQARAFLSGEDSTLQTELSEQMEKASKALEFEKAASLRDRIRALAGIRQSHGLDAAGMEDADIFAIACAGGQSCIQVFFLRAGQCRGTAANFPVHQATASPPDILRAFLSQFYDKRPCPALLLSNIQPAETPLLSEAFSSRNPRRVRLSVPQKGKKRKFVDQVQNNAERELARKLATADNWSKISELLVQKLGLSESPARIEVFDNSHISGSNAVGAMIVAGADGFEKRQYRLFNIRRADISPGDDYGMMHEVLHRRYAGADTHSLPDLVLLDGGSGHLAIALKIWEELGLSPDIPRLAAISKGEDRHAGREFLHLPGQKPFQLPERDLLLHYLQRLRDEAHRFAIGAHRRKRQAALTRSPLDNISGLGPARKRALLHRFGSVRGVAGASLNDLGSTNGISTALATRIHDYFHES